LLGEFGLVIAQRGAAAAHRLLQQSLETPDNGLPGKMRELLRELQDELLAHDARLSKFDQALQQEARSDERCQRLMNVEGIGPISATAIVAAVGDAKQFSSARQFAAWLGLVPSQHSSGGKNQLGSISKKGDTYLRTLLLHGSRSALLACKEKTDRRSLWVQQLQCRRNTNIATVALANKNAQIIWAILFGYLFFNEDIDLWTGIGTAVIIAAGIYIVLREDKASVSKNRPVLENKSRFDTGIVPRVGLWMRLFDRRKSES
jgi:transposase